MKVKAIISFNDLEENKHRKAGDIFECSKTRCDYLLEHKAVEIVAEEKNEEVEYLKIVPKDTEPIKIVEKQIEGKIEYYDEEKEPSVEFKPKKASKK